MEQQERRPIGLEQFIEEEQQFGGQARSRVVADEALEDTV
jgi:hypothetical protein